jgi:DNA-binding IclR family transcriptional regulator
LQPLRSTGLGKALLLDEPESRLREYYRSEDRADPGYAVSENSWLERMRFYAREGVAFDLEENEDRIRCVAAPIRDATGKIKAAISVSSAAHYMDDGRMRALVATVKRTAELISHDLGWGGEG